MDRLGERPDIVDIIKTVADAEKLKDHKVTAVKTNAKGEGYLGEIFMVTVTDGEKNLDLVIKSAFKQDKIRQLVPIRMCFENENYFYSKVYPEYRKFATEKGVKSEAELVPKCLGASLNDESEMLVLENLITKGFEMVDKKVFLDQDHVELILRSYGRFHGYSFALQDQNSDKFQSLAAGLQDVYEEILTRDIFRDNIMSTAKIVEGSLKAGEDDELIEAFHIFEGTKIMDEFRNSKSSDGQYSAILHGDCWSNNMMFKYEQIGGQRKVTDLRLLDFQLMKIGSPVCDLSYFLYSGASKEVFDKLDYYLRVYYESFSSFVRKLGSDPDKLFPFEKLKEGWKMYSKFGLIMAMIVVKGKLAYTDNLVDLTDTLEDEDAFTKLKFDEDEFGARMKKVLTNMIEIGAL